MGNYWRRSISLLLVLIILLGISTEGFAYSKIEEPGKAIVLALDTSGSMSYNQNEPIIALKDAAKGFCRDILSKDPNALIALVDFSYSGNPVYINGAREKYFTNDYNKLEEKINSLVPSGATNISDALKQSNELLKKINRRDSSIILMTDGGPDWNRAEGEGHFTQYRDKLPKYREYNGALKSYEDVVKESPKYKIYSVGFYYDGSTIPEYDKEKNIELLKMIQNSGYYNAVNSRELSNAYDKIAVDILEPLNIVIKINGEGNNIYNVNVRVSNENAFNMDNVKLSINLDNDSLNKAKIIGNRGIDIGTLNQMSDRIYDFKIKINERTFKAPDNINFTIRATASNMSYLEQKGKIAVDKINQDNMDSESNYKDNSLIEGRDYWSFRNINTSGLFNKKLLMSNEEISAYTKGLDETDRALIGKRILDLEKKGSNGHCYGMSATVILNKMNTLGKKELKYNSVLFDAKRPDPDSIIQYYQIMFSTKAVLDDVDRVSKKVLEKNAQITELLNKAEGIKNGGSPILLCYGFKDGRLNTGHAIVIYGVEDYDKDGFNKKFLAYDSNKKDLTRTYILANSETGHWKIPSYNLDTRTARDISEAYIYMICNDLNIINSKDYSTSMDNYKAYLRCYNETNMILTNLANKKSWEINGGNTELVTFPEPASYNNSPLNIILPDNKGVYELKAKNNGLAEFDNSILYGNKMLSVKADSAKRVIFDPADKVKISENNGDIHIIMAKDNFTNNEHGTYVINAKSGGNSDVNIRRTNSGIEIDGNLKDVSISGSTNGYGRMLKLNSIDGKININRNADGSLTTAGANLNAFMEDNTIRYVIGSKDYTITQNGQTQTITMDVAPFIQNDRTMLPLRFVAEAIGADVSWDQDSRTAKFIKADINTTIENDGREISLTVEDAEVIVASIKAGGSEIVLENGTKIAMDSPSIIRNDRMFVSLSNVAKVFNMTSGDSRDNIDYDIKWHHNERAVTIKLK